MTNALKVNNFSKKYKTWAEAVDQTKENKQKEQIDKTEQLLQQ